MDQSGEERKLEKSYFDVLGLCCSSEVPLVERILNSLDGVKEFSVIVPTKTVIVLHDSRIVSQIQIVKALNQARLEANVRAYGQTSDKNKWPSPYALLSGLFLVLSFLKYFYSPLRWLAIGAIAVGIVPITLKAFAALRNLTIDINILVLITVSGSVALHDYWEAATIVFLFTIAEWLESRASRKATATMSSLVSVVPQRAILADTGEVVNADEVKLNTVLAVKAGEVIPIDGVVFEGNCEVDEKFLTGESFPVAKEKDSTVWASTINLNGYITVKTTAVAKDCVVARMAKLVEDAQNKKSRTQRVIDKCAKYYTPAIVVISASVALVPVAFQVQNKKQWYHLSLVVLVSGCPCALLLSTPVAMFCALSKAAKLGVLFKGAEHLETLARVKTMAFDKTGTITTGEFLVDDFRSLQDNFDLETLLYWISSVESKSGHPMAAALVDFVRVRGVHPEPDKVADFKIFPGEGISGRIEDKDVYVGNSKIASRAGCVSLPQLDGYDTEGKSVGYVFVGSSPAAIFCLSDTCRTGAKEALMELRSMGIKTVMLTGDSYASAKHAQNQLGGALEVIHAELLPQDKDRIVKDLQAAGPTAMVGDGVNDALALATSDVGISMGVSGSALAADTGHVVLMSNDMGRIPRAARLARRVRWKIVQNVTLSVSTKAAIVGLAAAGHPLVWAAVLADVGTCLLVIFNSMLLLRGAGHSRGECCRWAHRDLESHGEHDHGCCTAAHKFEGPHGQVMHGNHSSANHQKHDHCRKESGSHNQSCCTKSNPGNQEGQYSPCRKHVSQGCEQTSSSSTKDQQKHDHCRKESSSHNQSCCTKSNPRNQEGQQSACHKLVSQGCEHMSSLSTKHPQKHDHCRKELSSHNQSCCTKSNPRNQEGQHSACHKHVSQGCEHMSSSSSTTTQSGCTKNHSAVKSCFASKAKQCHEGECCRKDIGNLESDFGGGLSRIVIE